jgi:hypothetical protein
VQQHDNKTPVITFQKNKADNIKNFQGRTFSHNDKETGNVQEATNNNNAHEKDKGNDGLEHTVSFYVQEKKKITRMCKITKTGLRELRK